MGDKTKGANAASNSRDIYEDCRVMYVGQDGYVVCLQAFGDACVADMPGPSTIGNVLTIDMLRPRAGQLGVLYWEPETSWRRQFPTSDRGEGFNYFIGDVSNSFAKLSVVQDAALGSFGDLVVKPYSAEEKYAQNGEGDIFLTVSGHDMDGAVAGPLRLWQFDANDVAEFGVYIIRGMKVVNAMYWSHETSRYEPRADGIKSIECSFRTVVEDGSPGERGCLIIIVL